MKSLIVDIHNKYISKDIEPKNLIYQYEKNTDTTNTFITRIDLKEQLNSLNSLKNNSLLYGIPYGMKDNISTKDIKTTGGSKFFEEYYPPFDATIYTLLNNAGAIMLGKTNLDEFGMAGTGVWSAYGDVLNPHDHDRIVGGSSSGSVNLVACGQAPFAIGTDTGDSVRRPASFVGVVGFKPTYGLISRYGVFPYAPSLDSIGINATNVTDTAIVADVICQYDQKDYSSQKMEHTFYKSLTTHKNICVGVIKDLEKHLSKDVLTYYLKAIDDIKKAGHTIKYIDLDETYLRSVHTIYYCLSYVEAYSCYMNITGITFGKNLGGNNYDEIITKNRTNGIGMEARARMIIGAYITKHNNFEKYFLRAQKIRRWLVNEWLDKTKDVDVVLTVGASSVAPKIEDVKSNKFSSTYADDLLCVANMGGFPSITIPYVNINGLPFGLNLTCIPFDDQKLLDVALTFEGLFERSKCE